MEKRCPRCGVVKPFSEFRRNRAKRDGRHTYCKPCHAERVAVSRPVPERRKEIMRAYYETPMGRASCLRAAAKMRSDGEIFTTAWLARKIEGGACEVTGIPFDLSRPDGGGMNPLAPSIDRIDSGKGYSPDNVQVVVFAFNAFKGRMSQDEAVGLIKRMAENL